MKFNPKLVSNVSMSVLSLQSERVVHPIPTQKVEHPEFPAAVWLSKSAAVLQHPIDIVLLALFTLKPALYPTAILLLAIVLFLKAFRPKATL